MSPSVSTGWPLNTWVSGRFGVTRVLRGSSSSQRALRPASERRLVPLVDTITGSTTTFLAPYCRSFAATARMVPSPDSMPILTLSGGMSVKMQSSCLATKSGEISCTPDTPVVFWAVRAVMTLMAYMCWAAMVLISA